MVESTLGQAARGEKGIPSVRRCDHARQAGVLERGQPRHAASAQTSSEEVIESTVSRTILEAAAARGGAHPDGPPNKDLDNRTAPAQHARSADRHDRGAGRDQTARFHRPLGSPRATARSPTCSSGWPCTCAAIRPRLLYALRRGQRTALEEHRMLMRRPGNADSGRCPQEVAEKNMGGGQGCAPRD